MTKKIIIAGVSTALSIILPLVLLLYVQLQGGPVPTKDFWGKYVFRLCLLVGIGGIHWIQAAMYFSRLQKEKPERAGETLADFIYPTTFLTVVNVLLVGFFSVADDLYALNLESLGGQARIMEVTRFGIAIIQVFPDVFFPLGVVMYAFWGAFIYNNYQFVRRIVDDDFTPRVLILATLRVVLAVFASILIYFALFPGVLDFGDLGAKGVAKISGGNVEVGALIVASFFAGLYPRQFLKMTYRWFVGRISQAVPILGKYTYTPLTVIQGITLEVEDRLSEAGIDSIQALATADVKELKYKKGLPYPEATIADWKDQAKLANYFVDEAEFAALYSLGIRTYSALRAYQEEVRNNPSILEGLDPKPLSKDKFRHFVLYGVFPFEAKPTL